MQHPMPQKISSSKVISLFLTLLTAFICTAIHANASEPSPPINLPEPTGSYGVGTTQLHLVDHSRLEEMTPAPDDHREIMVQVWYPTDKDISGATVEYMDAQTSAHMMGSAPEGSFDIFSIIQTHAVASAPPAMEAKPFPVLIFSPGLGLIYSAYQSYIEDIVSHGYVVAAVNHPYVSGITVFPDGRSVLMNPNSDIDTMHSVAVKDIEFLTGQLESIPVGEETLQPDVNNIGFFGHSMGGAAGVEVCLKLAQGKGAMNIDGSLFGQNHNQPIDKPIFIMRNQDYSVFNMTTWAEAWRNISQDGYMLSLSGSTHHTFMDLGLIFYQHYGSEYLKIVKDILNPGNINPEKAIKITREYILAFFDSCLKNSSADKITAIQHPETELELTSPADVYNGNWQSVGHGYALQIDNSNITWYEMTEVGMLPSLQGRIYNNYIYAGNQLIAKLALTDNALIMTYNAKNISFKPVVETQLPLILEKTTEPELNFEVFWQTFEENCSIFGLAKVDWHALYDKYRPQVSADTTDEDLFNIFSDMASTLSDGNTNIIDTHSNRIFNAGPLPSTRWTENVPVSLERIAKIMDDGILHSGPNANIRYGTIGGFIGYLNILSFSGYASPDGGQASVDLEKLIFDYAIDDVLRKLKNVKMLIIDSRFNQGGYDALALALADRFMSDKKLAFSADVRVGGYDEYSDLINRYTKTSSMYTLLGIPVALLTSNATAGAAEVFSMTMEQEDHVFLIGEKTYGAISTPLQRTLPNGWEFTLSNERYYSWQGINYEGQGVTPDIEIPYSGVGMTNKSYGMDSEREEKDFMLELGVQLLSSGEEEAVNQKE